MNLNHKILENVANGAILQDANVKKQPVCTVDERLGSLRPDLFKGFIILTCYHHVCSELFVQNIFFFHKHVVLTNSHRES